MGSFGEAEWAAGGPPGAFLDDPEALAAQGRRRAYASHRNQQSSFSLGLEVSSKVPVMIGASGERGSEREGRMTAGRGLGRPETGAGVGAGGEGGGAPGTGASQAYSNARGSTKGLLGSDSGLDDRWATSSQAAFQPRSQPTAVPQRKMVKPDWMEKTENAQTLLRTNPAAKPAAAALEEALKYQKPAGQDHIFQGTPKAMPGAAVPGYAGHVPRDPRALATVSEAFSSGAAAAQRDAMRDNFNILHNYRGEGGPPPGYTGGRKNW